MQQMTKNSTLNKIIDRFSRMDTAGRCFMFIIAVNHAKYAH